jgi:phosphate transport system substrate-binding protein
MTGVTKRWIEDFDARQKRVTVTLQSQASMGAPSALTSGVARIVALSRELNPSEVEAFRTRHGYLPTEIAVALGSYDTPTHTVALTFYVNDANPIQRLTLQQLDAMWCTTLHRGGAAQIMRWGQLGLAGDWVNAPIHLVGVVPPDGVPNFIERRVCDNGVSRSGIQGEKNGGATSVLTRIVQDVANDPYAIGYAGFHNRQPGTHAVQIAVNPSGPYFEGTFDEVRTAVYPLTRSVYLYVDLPPSPEPDDRPVRQFVDYVLSLQGQQQVVKDGTFMPLPARNASEQRKKIHRMQ